MNDPEELARPAGYAPLTRLKASCYEIRRTTRIYEYRCGHYAATDGMGSRKCCSLPSTGLECDLGPDLMVVMII